MFWITSTSKKRKQWVENRSKRIQKNVSAVPWRHVPGKLNPADIPTCKVSPKDLQNNVVWWEGATFLSKHKTEWPEQKEIVEIQSCDDVKETTVYVATTQKGNVFSLENVIDCTQYNSVKRLLNVTCYVFRFKNNLLKLVRKSVEKLHTGEISDLELKSAEELWVQYEQGETL